MIKSYSFFLFCYIIKNEMVYYGQITDSVELQILPRVVPCLIQNQFAGQMD